MFCINDECMKIDDVFNKEARRQEKKNSSLRKKTGAETFKMGSMFFDACLAQWIAKPEIQKQVQDWFKNDSPFLVEMGIPGCGKTYLSAALLNYFHEKNRDIYYTNHRRYIDLLKSKIQDGKNEMEVTNRHVEYEILILDDLGSATNTEWQQEMFLDLIDKRYSDNKKTLITTNFNQSEMKAKLGPRTASRILDKRNTIIEIWDVSHR